MIDYVFSEDLNIWLNENRSRLLETYGISIKQAKAFEAQGMINFLQLFEEIYELGIQHENEFLKKEWGLP
jgi:membrane-bound lytic murein transglycosylase